MPDNFLKYILGNGGRMRPVTSSIIHAGWNSVLFLALLCNAGLCNRGH